MSHPTPARQSAPARRSLLTRIGVGVLVLGAFAGAAAFGRTGYAASAAAGAVPRPTPLAAPSVTGPDGVARPAPTGQRAASDIADEAYPPEATPAARLGRPGELAIGSGVPQANPGGGLDLRADPAAGIGGAVPSPRPAGTPEDPSYPDAEVLAALGTVYANLTGSAPGASPTGPASGTTSPSTGPGSAGSAGSAGPGVRSIRAFTDPCVRRPDAPGCGGGIGAVVLGDRVRPPLATHNFSQVRPSDRFAGECARQLPRINFRDDAIFMVSVNQPVVARLLLQLNTPSVENSLIRIAHRGVLLPSVTGPSSELDQAWVAAFERGAATPDIPLCMSVSKAQLEQNRDGCLAEWSFGMRDCYSLFSVTYRTGCDGTDPACDAVDARLSAPTAVTGPHGPFHAGYSYDPQFASSDSQFGDRAGLTQEDLRRQVRLEPVDPLNVEVRIPMQRVTLEESSPNPESVTGFYRGRLMDAQMAVAGGYPAGTDCRAADPTASTTVLPVTRQGSQTRYWTPDPGKPMLREAVVNLTMPTLAQGEAVDICVFWYLLPTRSYDSPVVTSIEQHRVVPPARAATELSFIRATGPGPTVTDWDFQIAGNRRLDSACGFTDRANGRPGAQIRIGSPGFLCSIQSSMFVFEPQEITLYAARRPTGSGYGATRVFIDNRGCGWDGCGPSRTARIPLDDGSVELAVTKVPLSLVPLLPGGFISSVWRPDAWTLDPFGFTYVAPRLATPAVGPTPRVDTLGLRVVPNPEQPTTALDVIWRTDREVRMSMSATPTVAFVLAPPGCRSTAITLPDLRSSGRITIPGLCPNTTYRVSLQMTDPSTGQSVILRTDEGGTRVDERGARVANLVGRTLPSPQARSVTYEWSLAVRTVAGATPTHGVISDLQFQLGDRLLADRVATPGACMPLGEANRVAGGQGGGQDLGQMPITLRMTLHLSDAADCSGTRTRRTLTILEPVNWDGVTPVQWLLRNEAGDSFVVLTLRRVS